MLQTSEGQEKLHANYGPLQQKYLKAKTNVSPCTKMIYNYRNYGKRYDGTPGLYELIFNESIYTNDDVQTYRSILLTTNTHRRSHSPNNQLMVDIAMLQHCKSTSLDYRLEEEANRIISGMDCSEITCVITLFAQIQSTLTQSRA
ncbi:hypothetical protein G5I_13121 [Acromyrmex echinatior]|uniref:DUF8207 domain-containing protein n=1 Tax=Acromyrmex echinatior TaxID=103372 RepID=F4X462_ACREC|nr:hypothetical protein G5I_13121 [Acromyrmex echinatior]